MKRVKISIGRRLLASALLIAMASLVTGAWVASAQIATGTGRVIARVGPVSITDDTFEPRAHAAREAYKARENGQEPSPSVAAVINRSVLETMIRAHLMVLEAERRNVLVPDEEAEAFFKTNPFFKTGGTFDAAKYEAARANDPVTFNSGLANARRQLAGQRLERELRAEIAPDEAAFRNEIERWLTTAYIEYLALRRSDFSGEYDEPRESDVLAYYKANREDYRRPAEATLTALGILREHDHAAGEEEHPELIRPRADSAFAELRGGADFEAVAERYGQVARDFKVRPGEFPRFWEGGPSTQAQAFETKPGDYLPDLVPTHAGWMIVRVDASRPAEIRPLREVAKEVRDRVRLAALRAHEDEALRAQYETLDLPGKPAFRVRYAVFSLDQFKPRRPSNKDIDRYYRAHLADFSTYDPASGGLRKQPLDEVRDGIVAALEAEARQAEAEKAAERLEEVWRSGQRDRRLEGAAQAVHESGPLRFGGTIEAEPTVALLADTLSRQRGLTVGRMWDDDRLIVFHRFERLNDHPLSFEEVRKDLADGYAGGKRRRDEEAARRFHEANAAQSGGEMLYYSRLIVELPEAGEVELERSEVERYHRDNLDQFSAAAMINVRHILVSPENNTAEADQAALEEANDLMRRIRAGEDFAELARRHSDDPPTALDGGEVGYFSRGQMLEAFERVAFRMEPGELAGPVQTEIGYHIIEFLGSEPALAEPLPRIYTTVGYEVAREKAKVIARQLADSVAAVIRSVEHGRELVFDPRMRLGVYTYRLEPNTAPEDLPAPIRAMLGVAPGEIAPGVHDAVGLGSYVQWVDSLVPLERTAWYEVRERAMTEYKEHLARTALMAKITELDSLGKSGWSLDSLAALWGGLRVDPAMRPTVGLPSLGGHEVIDPIVYGTTDRAPIALDRATDWIELPVGFARLRVKERTAPDASYLARIHQRERRNLLEHRLHDLYEGLRSHFPVEILDDRLRNTTLPMAPKPMARQ